MVGFDNASLSSSVATVVADDDDEVMEVASWCNLRLGCRPETFDEDRHGERAGAKAEICLDRPRITRHNARVFILARFVIQDECPKLFDERSTICWIMVMVTCCDDMIG